MLLPTLNIVIASPPSFSYICSSFQPHLNECKFLTIMETHLTAEIVTFAALVSGLIPSVLELHNSLRNNGWPFFSLSAFNGLIQLFIFPVWRGGSFLDSL